MEPILRSIRRYRGEHHPWAFNKRVVIVAVHRGGDGGNVLHDDAEIGELRGDDVIELAPLIVEKDGRERASWVTSDAEPCELGAVEGRWSGPLEEGIVLERIEAQ